MDFFAEMEHHKKTTAAERVRVKAGADLIGYLPHSLKNLDSLNGRE